jgi:hypothetical protein
MGLDTKTYRLTDRQSQCDFDFESIVIIFKSRDCAIKTTSFTPPSVIKLHLLFAHAFTCFGFLVNHLQKAHQHFKDGLLKNRNI